MGIIDYAKAYFVKPKKDWQDAPKDTTGLTCFKVVNDLHIGSKYQDNPSALSILNSLENDGFTVLNGDIFDLACCKKKEVYGLLGFYRHFVSKFGDAYKLGNHERLGVDNSPLIKRTSFTNLVVGFTHGDLISDYEKWSEYRLKPHGAGFFKLLFTDFLDDLDHLKAMRPLPKKFLPNALAYCEKFGLDVLVCGHFHCEAERRYNVNGKLIIILPAHKVNYLYI